MEENNFRAGFVAIVGRPNAGKSTFINAVVGQKIAGVSGVAQTTRTRITAIYTDDEAQIIFLDTPGMHKPVDKLGEHMMRAATDSIKDADAILLVVDAAERFGAGEHFILKLLSPLAVPVVLALNKTDLVTDAELLSRIDEYRRKRDFAAVVPVSAQNGTNVTDLLAELKKLLPPGRPYYPEDYITDQPERLIAAEMIREKVLKNTRDEVPHAVAVEIAEMKKRGKKMFVRGIIYVEQESQKGIVIGKKGALLKAIGEAARSDIEKLVGSAVYLDLWVKVKKDWRKKDGAIKDFGLGG